MKLNPSLADAWLCLGNCIWKKGDLSSAKNCFTLALSKVILESISRLHLNLLWLFILFFMVDTYTLCLVQGPNKQVLCQLSMLERKMAQGNLLFFRLIFPLHNVCVVSLFLNFITISRY